MAVSQLQNPVLFGMQMGSDESQGRQKALFDILSQATDINAKKQMLNLQRSRQLQNFRLGLDTGGQPMLDGQGAVVNPRSQWFQDLLSKSLKLQKNTVPQFDPGSLFIP